MVANLLLANRISAKKELCLSSMETHFSNFKRMQSLIHVGQRYIRIPTAKADPQYEVHLTSPLQLGSHGVTPFIGS